MISEAASSGKCVIVFGDMSKESKYSRMVLNLESQGYAITSKPDEIYDRIKGILETRPEIKKLDDREKITERLKTLV